jgi:hypothetical protein
MRPSFFALSFAILTFFAPAGTVMVLAQSTPIPAANSGSGPSTSLNWAGYSATGGVFTSVNGTWNVPAIPSATITSGDATWVGIGGISGADLIQIGTQTLTTPSGAVQYLAFYETLPQTAQTISITINPGDSITASVIEQSTGAWSLSLKNNTSGQSFQTLISYASSHSSAEWIEEMPSTGNGSFIQIDKFGIVSFSGGSTIKNGNTLTIAGAGGQAITMNTSSAQALAATSSLGNDGASFSVTRTSIAPTSIPIGRLGIGSGRNHRTGVGVRGYVSHERYRIVRGNRNYGKQFVIYFNNSFQNLFRK